MGLVARNGGDALHEIEDRLGRASFLGQHRVDDSAGLGLRDQTLVAEGGFRELTALHKKSERPFTTIIHSDGFGNRKSIQSVQAARIFSAIPGV